MWLMYEKMGNKFVFIVTRYNIWFMFIFFDKSRSKYMTKKAGNNYLFRAIMTGIASVLEMGYSSERSTPTLKSTIITTTMIIIAFIIILYIQGEVTRILVKEEISGVNKSNIRSKPILGEEGYAVLKALEGQGATIERKENFDDIIKIYLEDTSKYLGVGMSYTESIPFSQIYD